MIYNLREIIGEPWKKTPLFDTYIEPVTGYKIFEKVIRLESGARFTNEVG